MIAQNFQSIAERDRDAIVVGLSRNLDIFDARDACNSDTRRHPQQVVTIELLMFVNACRAT